VTIVIALSTVGAYGLSGRPRPTGGAPKARHRKTGSVESLLATSRSRPRSSWFLDPGGVSGRRKALHTSPLAQEPCRPLYSTVSLPSTCGSTGEFSSR
jgi:hypothetical protein